MTSAEKVKRGQEMQQICGQTGKILRTKRGEGVKKSKNSVDVSLWAPPVIVAVIYFTECVRCAAHCTFEATAAPCAAQFHVLELLPITRSLKLLLTRLVKMSLQDIICTHVPKNNSVYLNGVILLPLSPFLSQIHCASSTQL